MKEDTLYEELSADDISKTIWPGEGKELLKEEKTKRIEAEKKLEQLTREQRLTQLGDQEKEPGKLKKAGKAITTIVAGSADASLSNIDSIIGGSSYLFFTLSIASFGKGKYLEGVGFLILSALFCAGKYQLPIGKLGGWMRKDTVAKKKIDEVVENVRKTIVG